MMHIGNFNLEHSPITLARNKALSLDTKGASLALETSQS